MRDDNGQWLIFILTCLFDVLLTCESCNCDKLITHLFYDFSGPGETSGGEFLPEVETGSSH